MVKKPEIQETDWLRVVSTILLVMIAAGSLWLTVVGFNEVVKWAAL